MAVVLFGLVALIVVHLVLRLLHLVLMGAVTVGTALVLLALTGHPVPLP
jgi:hypothetical protein